jgi:hypothetical protein
MIDSIALTSIGGRNSGAQFVRGGAGHSACEFSEMVRSKVQSCKDATFIYLLFIVRHAEARSLDFIDLAHRLPHLDCTTSGHCFHSRANLPVI